LIWPPSSSQEC